MAATIKAVAEAAGVSTTTVSFVLNNRRPNVDSIPKPTRDRVRMYAAAMGYRKNSAATTLKTGRSHWIGVLVQSLREEIDAARWAPYELALLSGIQNGLAQQGYFAVLGSKSSTGALDTLEAVVSSGVVGLIHRCPLREESHRMKELVAEGIPAVVVFPENSDDLYPYSIDMDNVRGGELVGELFMAVGPKAPMCITCEGTWQPIEDRWQGFSKVLTRETGVTPMICELPAEAESDEDGIEAVKKIITEHKPDAVMAIDGRISYYVSMAADQLGLSVPKDLMIIGFDCHSFLGARNQKLSSIAVSWWKAGYTAAESIIDIVCNKTTWTEPRKLEPLFIPGNSTPLELGVPDSKELVF